MTITSPHENKRQLPLPDLLQGASVDSAPDGMARHPEAISDGGGSAPSIPEGAAVPNNGSHREGQGTTQSIDARLYGVDMFGESMRPAVTSPVAQKFLVPPFTVLNAREGDWQDRKRAWLAFGIAPETKGGMAQADGRKAGLLGGSGMDGSWVKRVLGDDYTGLNANSSGTSIFDPVVCELAYRWFSGEGAQILDPFAGGSVRGIVASHLGRKYWGCDLRAEQIEANRAQGAALCDGMPQPEWVCGDSLHQVDLAPDADLVFSCPPYGDLEVYSDLPDDLSAMSWPEFRTAYRAIIAKACGRLRNNRFACFVVGDFRDNKGNYRNFVSETISAFMDAGLALYNEAILITSVGSASMRVTKQFNAGRKLCKTHQNVLVFVKGDGRKAADNIKESESLHATVATIATPANLTP